MTPKVVAATGHRPDKLGPDGYSPATNRKLYRIAGDYLSVELPDLVIQGMALGWDQAVGHAAIDLGIPVLAALPHNDQEAKWPIQSRIRYHAILNRCFRFEVVSPGPYAAWKMQARNVWMVERATKLAALWDGTAGGTFNCIRYARDIRPEVQIDNLWPEWRRAA